MKQNYINNTHLTRNINGYAMKIDISAAVDLNSYI